MRAKLDKILNKFISKKLTVFIIATVFLALGSLDSYNWVNLAMIYIGSQAALDIMLALRK